MVNDLHRLGPGSVGGGGGGGEKGEGAKRDEQQTNIDERSEPSGRMEPPRIPVRLTDIFSAPPPGHNLCGGETMQNNTSCAQTLLTLSVEKTISHLDPPPPPSLSLFCLLMLIYVNFYCTITQ